MLEASVHLVSMVRDPGLSAEFTLSLSLRKGKTMTHGQKDLKQQTQTQQTKVNYFVIAQKCSLLLGLLSKDYAF